MDDNPRGGAPDTSGPKIIRPIPRRPFKLGGFSSPTPPEEDDEHTPQRPQISANDLRFLAPHQHTTTPGTRSKDGSAPLSHTTSYLNLTSPTLFGIYSPSTLSGSFTKDGDNQDQDQDGDGDRGQYFPSVDGNNSDGDILASGTGTPGPQPDLDEETYSLIRKRSRSRRSSTLLPSQPTTTATQYKTRTRQQRKRVVALQLVLRAALLFALGVGYGILVTRLPQNTHHLPHSSQRLAAYESHYEWRYLAVWGAAGVVLGSLLPWFDRFWEARTTKPPTTQKSTTTTTPTRTAPPPHRADDDNDDVDDSNNNEETPDDETTPETAAATTTAAAAAAADYPLVVRGIGAFVGIVFAIRKLPWASTMQVSLTLALANPFLWYLIDRSKPGFLLSAAVGLAGSAVLMGLDLGGGVMPAPAAAAGAAAILEDGFGGGNATAAATAAAGGYPGNGRAFGGLASQETIETTIWMLSVLFCSCVCFGNIGRRLALNSSAAGRGRWGGVR